jgi:hypothetical protein
MLDDISGIVELLRQINNITANNSYNDPRSTYPARDSISATTGWNDPFIDGIHRNFPDLLYNNARFSSVQSVMEYINHQMNNNYNTYNRNFADYWNTRTPVGSSEVGLPRAGPATRSSHSAVATNIFSQIHNDVLEGSRMLNSLSNASTHAPTPIDSPLLSGHRGTYMDDEVLLNGLETGNGIGSIEMPATPPRPTRRMSELPPQILRRGRGAHEMFRNLIPDFLSMAEPTLFMATARTYRVHPLNELNQINENNVGLTHEEINRVTHIQTHINDTSDREGECPICYDDYSGNDLRVINSCNHAFHSECIERWFMGNRTCPMCRVNVGGTGVQPGLGMPSNSPAETNIQRG